MNEPTPKQPPQPAPTRIDRGYDPRRCWNCGTTPNLRCCEFGRDR